MTFDQIKEICTRVLGSVLVRDLGILAPGVHGIEIIVGQRQNPTYLPIIPKDSAFYDPKNPDKPFGEPFENDVRILKLNDTEDMNAIIVKLKPIKDTLPENRTAYKNEMSTLASQEDAQVAKEMLKDTAEKNQEDGMKQFMGEVLSTLEAMNKRIENIESKGLTGAPTPLAEDKKAKMRERARLRREAKKLAA